MSTAIPLEKSRMQRVLDIVERVGNQVPHPAVIFLLLILATMLLAHVFYISGAAVEFERINPETHEIEIATAEARSLLTGEGVRHMYTSMIPNFMGFTAVGLLIAAMIGVGVAEHGGRQRAAEVDVEALELAGLVDVAEAGEGLVDAAAQLAALPDGVHDALGESRAEQRE